MRAEIIIDLQGFAVDLGSALGRRLPTFPSLGRLARMWRALGIEVGAMHLIAPGGAITGRRDSPTRGPRETAADASFSELDLTSWWATEKVFAQDEDFEVSFHLCPKGTEGPLGLNSLMVTTALSRSDALAELDGDHQVIVMGSSASLAAAVTHARGAAVMIAGTTVPDSGLAHARLQPEWITLCRGRDNSDISLDGVELVRGRPWFQGVTVGTPYLGLEGRDESIAVLPSFAKSAVVLDPGTFYLAAPDEDTVRTPGTQGIATLMQRLGFGELVHVETIDDDERAQIDAVATTYRFAADDPSLPIMIASSRKSILVATNAASTFHLANRRRLLRLCLPEREVVFDESVLNERDSISRVVIDQSQLESLFADDIPEDDTTDDGDESVSRSPVLTLYSNPNTSKADSERWRETTSRRLLMVGAKGDDATFANSPDGPFLPVALAECTDFAERPPILRAGAVVEGVISPEGDHWIIVSDPIERRAVARELATAAETSDADSEDVQLTAAA